MIKKRVDILLLCVFMSAGTLTAAEITVPKLELITKGELNQTTNRLELASQGNMDIAIQGGYKFGGAIGFAFKSSDLLNFDPSDPSSESGGYDPAELVFQSASLSIRDVFNLPVNLSYFIGQYDRFASGNDFYARFGSEPIGSNFSGYMYFADGVKYDGIHSLFGTGIALSTRFNTDWNETILYAYQDNHLGSGFYSLDLRSLFNFDDLKLEAFVGGTFPAGTAGLYRAGLLFYYRVGDRGSFLTQLGIPRWNIMGDPLSINLFYFLFEPRIYLGDWFGIVMTLFWHPEYYEQTTTGELGSVDLNIDFTLGNKALSPLSGGLESKLSYSPTGTQFATVVSPYLRVLTSGIIWDFKVNVNLIPFDISQMFVGYIGVKAEF